MPKTRPYSVPSGWRLILRDAGIHPGNVLRRAQLPADLFAQERASLTADRYFRLWRGIGAEANDPTLPLRLGAAISVEAFEPPIFAAFCSPDLNTALARIARYKPLIGPMLLRLTVTRAKTTMTIEWQDASPPPPNALVLTDLTFFVQIARLATRERICPLEVWAPNLPEHASEFTKFFGAPVKKGRHPRIVFSAHDATRPFLTANDAMWRVFEPDLRRRLSELDAQASMSDRVQAALLELLPGSAPSMSAVAHKLGTSARTLQRRLQEENESYQGLLGRTRRELASHYLKNTALPGGEISYLLGYEDPNCFFRAFRGWTGTTPARVRASGGGLIA